MADGDGSSPKDSGSKPPGGSTPRMSRSAMSWLVLLGLAMLLVALLSSTYNQTEPISIDRFYQYVEARQIARIEIHNDGLISGELKTGAQDARSPSNRFRVQYPLAGIDYDFLKELRESGAEIKYVQQSQFLLLLVTMLPWLLIMAVIWFVIIRQLRGAGGPGAMLGNFGRSKHRVAPKEHMNVSFNDVAGINEAKEDVEEIIEFLRAPKKFQRLGGRIPHGVLLVGEPGCGKTLLAKAIAGEADVPFFSISGSDFVEMFVGVGASRVRDLFKQAKESSPCIIFLDEIDAVGRKRGANFGGGGHDEREQTLNAILVEMDGFDTSSQVIVIAATNRADVLDPALVRPGRFDRQVYVPLPDMQGRYEILKVHCRKIKLGPTVDLRRAARGTPMFNGADLAALVNEAALLATMDGKEFVEQDDFEEARDKIKFGRARKSRTIEEKERKATAYHEAGHAVVQAMLPDADPVHKVTIIPRGQFGGATYSLPEKDRYGFGLKYLQATMRVMCAGRIAEERATDDISSGASQDIAQVTAMARTMVLEWGMSDKLGFVRYTRPDQQETFLIAPEYSDETAKIIDTEIRRISDEAYEESHRLLDEHWTHVEAVAEALLTFETVTGDELNALIRGESIQREGVSDLLDQAGAQDQSVGMARPVESNPKTDAEPGADLDSGPLAQPG